MDNDWNGGREGLVSSRSVSLIADVIESEEFTVAYVSILTMIGLGFPLLIECIRHLQGSRLDIGCSYGIAAIIVLGVSGWKLCSALSSLYEGIPHTILSDESML